MSAGALLGEVTAVHDYGAGTSLEIARGGAGPLVVPFTREAVPVIDVAGGRLVVAPPTEIEMRGVGGVSWHATVLTLFPEMFPGPLGQSLAGRALAAGVWRWMRWIFARAPRTGTARWTTRHSAAAPAW